MPYKQDLAYIQHHGFADFSEAVAPGVLRQLRKAGIRRGHVVDVGCGDGGWLRTLVEHGYSVTGIDQSSHLLKFARAIRGANVIKGSAWRTSFPSCDAITALGEVFSYCSDSRDDEHPAVLFRRAYAALRPGGALIFDVLVEGTPMAYTIGRAGRDWAVLATISENRKRRRLTREIVTFRKIGSTYRRGAETHVLRVFSKRGIIAALRQAGFRARASARYGKAALPFRRHAFVATKPLESS